MEKPNYILRTDKACITQELQHPEYVFLRAGMWITIAVIMFDFLPILDSTSFKLPWLIKILLFVISMMEIYFLQEKSPSRSPMEMHFFDDRLVLYSSQREFSKKVVQTEIGTMKYSDIDTCKYKPHSHEIYIRGYGTSNLYYYKKGKTCPNNPTYSEKYAPRLIYFNTQSLSNIDVKNEIESHSPIKVSVEDNEK